MVKFANGSIPVKLEDGLFASFDYHPLVKDFSCEKRALINYGWVFIMGIRVVLVSICLLFFSVFPLSGAAQCSGGGIKPAWVDSPESVTDEYFFAAGVSDDTKAALADRISSAKQNALKNISEMIEVSVKNSLILEQSSQQKSGKIITDSNLLSITKTSTNASLKNVEVIDTWEDSRTCAIWLRAKVSKRQVEQGKREGLAKILFGVMNEQMAVAQNDTAPLDTKLSAVDAALDVLPRIALEFIPEARSNVYYADLLERIRKNLRAVRNDLDEAKKAMSDADSLINKAAEQTDENIKSKLLGSAAGSYRALLAKHSNGLPPLFGPGDILFKLAEVEETRGNSCGAKNYYQQSSDSNQVNDRKPIAKKRGDALACSAEDMERTLWRQYFEGRPTVIVCYYHSNIDQGIWHKACDGINNILKPLGADTTVRAQNISADQLHKLQAGDIPGNLAEKDKLLLVVFASGKMNSRIDKESPGKSREYQFDGGMATFLVEDGKTTFSDRFQGRTGWNPISSQMVSDVLAINVVKRWREKFSKFLRHELDQ